MELQEPQVSDLPVGQQTHPGVDQQLDQSLGGEEQPHSGVLLGQELPTLQAAPGWGVGGAGGVSWGLLPVLFGSSAALVKPRTGTVVLSK